VVDRLSCLEIPAVGSHNPKTGRSAQKKKKKKKEEEEEEVENMYFSVQLSFEVFPY
jgi:hypothetical protein